MGEQKRFQQLPPDIQREYRRQREEEQSQPVKDLEQCIENAQDAILTLFTVSTAEAHDEAERDDCTRAAAVAMATIRQMFAATMQILPGPAKIVIADAVVKTIQMAAPDYDQTLRAAMASGHARRKRILEIGPEAFMREEKEAHERAVVELERMTAQPMPLSSVDRLHVEAKEAKTPTHMTLGEAERAGSGEGESNG